MKNEPAFPWKATPQDAREDHNNYSGMTLRDYFAAKAITGACIENLSPSVLADQAYKLADAMLKERDRLNAGKETP